MIAVLTEERPIQATACVHCSREVLVDEVTLSIDADGTEVISTEELMERLKWLQEEKKAKDADPENWLKKGSARQLWTEAGQETQSGKAISQEEAERMRREVSERDRALQELQAKLAAQGPGDDAERLRSTVNWVSSPRSSKRASTVCSARWGT